MELRFRSPTDNVLHVTTIFGHAARIGPDWRELPPILHKPAIAAGAITDNMTADSINASNESADPPFSQEAEIRKAIIAMLGEDDPTNFTNAGVPNLNKLSARCGFTVDREQMQQVWADLDKSSAETAG
jgi:hypothetical protein